MTKNGIGLTVGGSVSYRNLFLLALVFSLLGCTPAARQIDSGYELSESADAGVILASVTYQGSYSAYSMRFRAMGETAVQRLQIGASQTIVPAGMQHWDIESPGTRGQLFAVELPAGRYELFEWAGGSGAASLRPSEEFSIPFDVLPGEVTYIGNFNFKATGRFGATITALNVMHVDEFYRDTEIAAEKFPRLYLEQIALKLPPGYYEEMVGGATNTTITLIVM